MAWLDGTTVQFTASRNKTTVVSDYERKAGQSSGHSPGRICGPKSRVCPGGGPCLAQSEFEDSTVPLSVR